MILGLLLSIIGSTVFGIAFAGLGAPPEAMELWLWLSLGLAAPYIIGMAVSLILASQER